MLIIQIREQSTNKSAWVAHECISVLQYVDLVSFTEVNNKQIENKMTLTFLLIF